MIRAGFAAVVIMLAMAGCEFAVEAPLAQPGEDLSLKLLSDVKLMSGEESRLTVGLVAVDDIDLHDGQHASRGLWWDAQMVAIVRYYDVRGGILNSDEVPLQLNYSNCTPSRGFLVLRVPREADRADMSVRIEDAPSEFPVAPLELTDVPVHIDLAKYQL